MNPVPLQRKHLVPDSVLIESSKEDFCVENDADTIPAKAIVDTTTNAIIFFIFTYSFLCFVLDGKDFDNAFVACGLDFSL